MTWKDFIANEKKLYYNPNYWLKILLTILACALTINISIWLYAMFIVAIWGFIENEYTEDLPLKENDRIRVRELDCLHDYYFVKYVDDNQKQAYVTVFPGGEESFYKVVDVDKIRKDH